MDGLRLVTTLRETDRFVSWQAELDGQPVFAKQPKNGAMVEKLAAQVRNARRITAIGATMTESPLRAPEIIRYEPEMLVTEWLPGETLESELTASVGKFASWLAVFDRLPAKAAVPSFSSREVGINDTPQWIRERLDDLAKPLRPPAGVLARSLDRLAGDIATGLEVRTQDADIKPSHVYHDPAKSEGYVLIDSEHLRDDWPRFYDLGNLLAKYWCKDQWQAFGSPLLQAVIDKGLADETTLWRHVRATFLVRGLLLHVDYAGLPPQATVRQRAATLLENVLAANAVTDLPFVR